MSAMSQHPVTLRRLPLLLLPLAAVSLLSGLLAGLIRIGWALPTPSADLILLHGPLMVAGFFGTLIGLERAVALQKAWVYGAPVLVGFGGLTLAVGGPVALAEEAIVLGSLIYLVAVAQWETPAWHMLGAALVCLTFWLARHDLARRTVHGRGVARFSAICLLSGYVWLGLAGLVAIASADPAGGFAYDATLHAVFLGFVFAMVFGHAPIILPAVLRIAVPFRRAFYAPLGLLHVGLVLRIFGDLLTWEPGRLWGGMIDVLAILGFAGTVATAALTAGARGDTQGRHASKYVTIRAEQSG
jgi:hypothetical protein